MEKVEIARRIAAARSYAFMKRPELAASIDVHVNTVTRWEDPDQSTTPRRGMLLAIIAVTGVRPDWFDDGLTLRAVPAPPPGAYEGLAPRPPGMREAAEQKSATRRAKAS